MIYENLIWNSKNPVQNNFGVKISCQIFNLEFLKSRTK